MGVRSSQQGLRALHAGEPFQPLVAAAVEAYPHIPICMHQDHGASPGVCMRSIQSGFSSVMMDGSLLEDGKTGQLRVQRARHARLILRTPARPGR